MTFSGKSDGKGMRNDDRLKKVLSQKKKKNEKMPSHVKSNFQEMPPSKIQTKMFINASIILVISVDSKMSDIFVNKNDFVWIIDERF